MPPRSKIAQLPDELRAELDRKLVKGGFSKYVDLAKWLADRGHNIGKSAVGEYGQTLQRRLDAIRASTDAARQISAAAPDDADERSNAIISMVQTELFQSLMAMQEATDEDDPAKRAELLGKLAKNIATLTRASISRNKWGIEVRQKVTAAAEEVQKIARKAGISDEVQRQIDERIMGIS